jgi:hypothetical protein
MAFRVASYNLVRRIACIAVCSSLSLLAKAPERSVEVTTVDKEDLAGGGTIRISTVDGELHVEGWDQPTVEITLARTAFCHASAKEMEEGEARLKGIEVVVRKTNSGDLEISSRFPARNWLLRTFRGPGDFSLDYRVKVPRNAKLVIRHDVGDVLLHGVAADIDARNRAGDIVLQLPETDRYAIDARCEIGNVYSDFDGAHRSPHLVGEQFDTTAVEAHRIHLRVLIGGISIQKASAPLAGVLAPGSTR